MQRPALARRIGRAVTDLENEVLTRLARLVRNAPEQRLDQLMRTPARHVIIGGIFRQLRQQLDPNLPAGVDASIQLRVTTPRLPSADTYNLVIAERRSRVIRGDGAPSPLITVTVDGTEFLRLAAGGSNPMRSYFAGKLKLTGDVMLAIRLIGQLRAPPA